MSPKAKKGFNTPFADLRKKLTKERKAEKREAAKRSAEDRAPPSRTSRGEKDEGLRPQNEPVRSEAGGLSPASEEDRALFEKWLGDVEPLPAKGRRRVVTPRRTSPPRGTTAPDEDGEVLAALSDLVAGEGEFDISDTDEYVEGIAPGIDRRLLRRLRRGDFSVQSHLDLHGMVRGEAKEAVAAFIRSSRLAGKRCVIIVHGRGLRSPGGEPVLKKALVRWLSRGALGKQVLAFTSTLAYDGGGGAMYVLLRR